MCEIEIALAHIASTIAASPVIRCPSCKRRWHSQTMCVGCFFNEKLKASVKESQHKFAEAMRKRKDKKGGK